MFKLLVLFLSTLVLFSCQTAASFARKGDYYYSYSDYSQAVEFYQKANSIKVRDRYQYNLAASYIKLEEYSSAIDLFSSLLKEQPDNVLIMHGLAYSYDKNGNSDLAIAIYDQLLEINKMDDGALRGRALILQKRGQMPLALSELKSFYQLSSNKIIQNTIALIYVLGKNDAMALQWLDNNPELLVTLKNSIDQ